MSSLKPTVDFYAVISADRSTVLSITRNYCKALTSLTGVPGGDMVTRKAKTARAFLTDLRRDSKFMIAEGCSEI